MLKSILDKIRYWMYTKQDWYDLSIDGELSEEFITKHMSKLDMYNIVRHQNVSEDFIYSIIDKVRLEDINNVVVAAYKYKRIVGDGIFKRIALDSERSVAKKVLFMVGCKSSEKPISIRTIAKFLDAYSPILRHNKDGLHVVHATWDDLFMIYICANYKLSMNFMLKYKHIIGTSTIIAYQPLTPAAVAKVMKT